mmetsp:Transcript_1238/g.1679  ORF Transcript_1238/g.1679 Transcript_1238/m.1679 type:complete len:118 (-) Transcript_1238:169-522(-)
MCCGFFLIVHCESIHIIISTNKPKHAPKVNPINIANSSIKETAFLDSSLLTTVGVTVNVAHCINPFDNPKRKTMTQVKKSLCKYGFSAGMIHIANNGKNIILMNVGHQMTDLKCFNS